MRVALSLISGVRETRWRDCQVQAENETGVTRRPAKGHDIPAVPRSQQRGMGFTLLRLPQGTTMPMSLKKKKVLFYINNVGIVSGGQQRYAAIHTYKYPFFPRLHLPSRLHITLSRVPWASLVHFTYSSVSLSIPDSLLSLPLSLPLSVSTSWFQISCFQHCERLNICFYFYLFIYF